MCPTFSDEQLHSALLPAFIIIVAYLRYACRLLGYNVNMKSLLPFTTQSSTQLDSLTSSEAASGCPPPVAWHPQHPFLAVSVSLGPDSLTDSAVYVYELPEPSEPGMNGTRDYAPSGNSHGLCDQPQHVLMDSLQLQVGSALHTFAGCSSCAGMYEHTCTCCCASEPKLLHRMESLPFQGLLLTAPHTLPEY